MFISAARRAAKESECAPPCKIRLAFAAACRRHIKPPFSRPAATHNGREQSCMGDVYLPHLCFRIPPRGTLICMQTSTARRVDLKVQYLRRRDRKYTKSGPVRSFARVGPAARDQIFEAGVPLAPAVVAENAFVPSIDGRFHPSVDQTLVVWTRLKLFLGKHRLGFR